MTENNTGEGRVKASLYLSDEVREKIRATGLTLEDYFNRMYKTYTSFDMDRWVEGAFWKQYFRVAVFTSETLNSVLGRLDDDAQYRAGLEAGTDVRTGASIRENVTPEELPREDLIRDFNDYCGWGKLIMRNESAIMITQPFFEKPHFAKGYLEGMLGIKLQIVEASHTRVTYRVLG